MIEFAQKATWNKRWKGSEEKERLTLLGRRMFQAKRKTLMHRVSRLPARTVLEVGCGLGHTMEAYCDLGLDVTGIDISEHAVACCKNKGFQVLLHSVEEMAGAFDLVSSDGLLEHFLYFEPYARHFMRLSKRYVLLIQPNHESILGKTLVYLAELLRSNTNVHEFNYRMADFIQVFEKNHFKVIQNQPIFGDVFRLLLFEKTSK